MNTIRILMTLSCAALLMEGCGKLPGVIVNGESGEKVPLNVSVQATSFDGMDGEGFAEGDRIGLSVSVGGSMHIDNKAITFGGGAWTAGMELVWHSDKSVTADISAYYPYFTGSAENIYPLGDEPLEFAVQKDQSSVDGYRRSRLMNASRKNMAPSEAAVQLKFVNLMSRLAINIENGSGHEIKAVSLSGAALTVRYDGSYTICGDPESVKACALESAESGYSGSYQMILPPQTAGNPVLKIEFSSGESVERTVGESLSLASGKQQSISVVLASQGGGDDSNIPGGGDDPDNPGGGDKPVIVKITVDGDILDWTDDESLDFHRAD